MSGDYDILDIVNNVLETERAFYNTIRFLEGGTRNNLIAAHMRNMSQILNIVRNYQTTEQRQSVVLNIPIRMDASGNFFDNVPVVPTAEQIRAGTESHIAVTDTTCSICQTEVTCATRIRGCGHCFHGDCIAQWFTMNPRCPMCRHDIRDRNLLRETPSNTTNESRSMHTDERS